MPASVEAPMVLAWLAATVELESADQLVHMRRDLIHLESHPDGTALMAGTTHHKPRLERRFIVQLRGNKIVLLPGSLLVRQIIRVAITSREINLELALPGNPISSPVIIREQIGISVSKASRPQKM